MEPNPEPKDDRSTVTIKGAPLPTIIEVIENRRYWEAMLEHLERILKYKDDGLSLKHWEQQDVHGNRQRGLTSIHDGLPVKHAASTVDVHDHRQRIDRLYDARNELKRLEAWSMTPSASVKKEFNVTWDCQSGSFLPQVTDSGELLSGKQRKRIRTRAFQQQLDNNLLLDRLAKDPHAVKRLREEIAYLESSYTGYVPKPSPVGGEPVINTSTVTEVGYDQWPPSTAHKSQFSESSLSEKRQAEQKLNDVLWATWERLSGKTISSGLTMIIVEMFELIDVLFTPEEREMIQTHLFRIQDELKREHNWTGTDFYSEPNSVHLKDTIAKLITSSSQS